MDDKRPTSTASLSTAEGLVSVWERFRAGVPILCSADDGLVALSVDSSATAYRFVCTHCGAASPWFRSTPTGVRLEPSTPASPPPARSP